MLMCEIVDFRSGEPMIEDIVSSFGRRLRRNATATRLKAKTALGHGSLGTAMYKSESAHGGVTAQVRRSPREPTRFASSVGRGHLPGEGEPIRWRSYRGPADETKAMANALEGWAAQ